MRLQKYLTEDTDINKIYTECMPFIQEWKNIGIKNGLLRGVKANFNIQKADATKYRLPKDVSLNNSLFVDKIYKDSIGFNLRSSSVFCTHKQSIAEYYGNVYYVVPCGEYKLFVNPTIQDLFTDIFSWQGTPILASPGFILDPIKIVKETVGINGIKIPSDMDSVRIKSTATRALLPFLLTKSEKERIVRLNQAYLTQDNLIFENENKIYTENKKLTGEEAYNMFWKYAYKILESKVRNLISRTMQISLTESLKYKEHEIMLLCKSYYLVHTSLLTELQ